MSALVWAFIEGPQRGWTDGLVVGGFVGAVVLGVGFVAWELRRREPMLDPRLFALRGFGAGSLSVFVQFFAAFGVIFVLLQYLQLVLGYSPLEAGRRARADGGDDDHRRATGPAPGRALRRAADRPARPGADGDRARRDLHDGRGLQLLAPARPAASLLGLGMALAATPATAAIVDSLPEAKQGVASAVNDAAREVGGALGIAVLGSVLADHVGRLGPGMDPAAFVDGFSAALLVGAGVLATGALIVAWRAPGHRAAPVLSSAAGRSAA